MERGSRMKALPGNLGWAKDVASSKAGNLLGAHLKARDTPKGKGNATARVVWTTSDFSAMSGSQSRRILGGCPKAHRQLRWIVATMGWAMQNCVAIRQYSW